MKSLLLLILLTTSVFVISNAQSDTSVLARMQGLRLEGDEFLSVDGVAVSFNTYQEPFSEEGLLKKYRRYRLNTPDFTGSDTSLPFRNVYARKQVMKRGVVHWQNIYIFENKEKNTTAVAFIQSGKNDQKLEKNVLNLLYNRQIPETVYAPMPLDTINFAGRKFRLGDSCEYRGVNNVFCEKTGQMSWSIHRTEEDAMLAHYVEMKTLEERQMNDIQSKDSVAVVFEGQPVKALKIICKNKAMAAVRDNNVLSLFYVIAPVRGNYVYCRMSFWNRQQINPSGLSPLLEHVMLLSK